MSGEKASWVRCDGREDCDATAPWDHSCATIGEAREFAKSDGWHVALQSIGGRSPKQRRAGQRRRDICPDCWGTGVR